MKTFNLILGLLLGISVIGALMSVPYYVYNHFKEDKVMCLSRTLFIEKQGVLVATGTPCIASPESRPLPKIDL